MSNIVLASHLHIVTSEDKQELSQHVFAFMSKAYEYLEGGFLSFDSLDDLIDNSLYWKIVYSGSLDNIKDFEMNKCLAMTLYKQKAGLKRVASGINKFIKDKNIKIQMLSGYKKLIKDDFKYAWAEVSERAENFMMSLGGSSYIIDPNKVQKVFPNVLFQIDEDKKHYYRELGGKMLRKIAVGNIKI